MLKISKLFSGYNHIRILRDINLRVDQGEFVALVGGNGAGKSTLMKTISGLIAPTSGKISFGDITLSGQGTERAVDADGSLTCESAAA